MFLLGWCACLILFCNCSVAWPRLLPDHVEESGRFISIPDIQISVNNETLIAPEIEGPDLQTPVLSAPQIQTPDLQGPEIEAPDIQAPVLQGPDLEAPDLQGPDFESPDLQEPDLQAPDLDIQSPELQPPEWEPPEIQGPELQAPALGIEPPNIQPPSLDAPQFPCLGIGCGDDTNATLSNVELLDTTTATSSSLGQDFPDTAGLEKTSTTTTAKSIATVPESGVDTIETTATSSNGLYTITTTSSALDQDFPDTEGLEMTSTTITTPALSAVTALGSGADTDETTETSFNVESGLYATTTSPPLGEDFPDASGLDMTSTTTPAMTITKAPELCRDHHVICTYFWLKWMCHDPLMFWFKIGCPRTCDLCYGQFCKSPSPGFSCFSLYIYFLW